MPAYEFACDKCGHTFTVQRRMDSRVTAPACPRCRSALTRQQFNAFYAKTIKKS